MTYALFHNESIWPRRRFAFSLRGACVLVSVLCTMWAGAQSRVSEYDVKAAYLFNFGKFIRVSSQSEKPDTFNICIVGQDVLGNTLVALTANEQIDHRPVRIRRQRDAAEARSCDIAYLGSSEGEKIDSDLAALRGTDVLTVSDAPHFLDRGGMIQFVTVEKHVRFEVNLNAVKRTNLMLSSELLRVALSVIGSPAGEAHP